MAGASYYVSTSAPSQDTPRATIGVPVIGSLNSGTASSANDPIELRISTVGTGYFTGMNKGDVVKALIEFERWVMDGGLDAVIATSGTIGIP